MDWLLQLFTGHSVAHTVIILSLVIALGVAIGHIKVFGISLGIAGVLFSGLLFGHFQLTINEEILEFCREFGLVLFVYTIGMQVGPGFFSSFRKQGLRLNMLAASIVLGGVIVALVIHLLLKVPVPVVVGLLSGAVTNTPGLGAAQQALSERLGNSPDLALPGMAYAVAYPFGILGIILTMIAVRHVFRINPEQEAEAYDRSQGSNGQLPQNYNIEISNARLAGIQVRTLAATLQAEFVISRLLRGDKVEIPDAETRLQLGDVLHVVCTAENAEKLSLIVGDVSKVDVRAVPSVLTARNILITQRDAVGKKIRELDLVRRYGVAITRVNRAGTELVANAGLELQFGDRVTVVGGESSLKKVSVELGDSIKKLNHPNILPVFIGIILGVILGSIPFKVAGVPAPVKLGLAGGPLLVSILLSRYGRIGPVVWYLPLSANLVLREVGITLFLACVGLKSGGRFVETLVSGDGLYWMGLAALITAVPLAIVALVARYVYKLNYLSLCGLLAGSMTDPPALGFANQIAASDAPAITYASVYALTMFLRILTAQALVLILL
ncbi:MAG: putative transporter [Kiritimatiellae bacterium]|nr:putative transporter [Kiritimatiellia bacterium]MCO5060532.1 putative transporter [Kiritimatiellia bacterium]MCO5068408.1 putative transporter [Kiritimatiellia bacterium]MCO6400726.1 putative transporter [Verrucomicrobiota bacterium]